MSIASLIWSTVLKPAHDALCAAHQETVTWLGKVVTSFSPVKEEKAVSKQHGQQSENRYGDPWLDGLPAALYSLIGHQLEPGDLYSSFLASEKLFKEKKQFLIGHDTAVSQIVRSVQGDIKKLLLAQPDHSQLPMELVYSVTEYFCPTKPRFTEKELRDIGKSINTLDLQGMPVTIEAIKQIVEYFPNVEVLNTWHDSFHGFTVQSDAVLKEIAKLSKLKTLKLSLDRQIQQRSGIDHLVKLTALEHLQISGLHPQDVAKFAQLVNLRSLAINCCSDEDLEIIRHMPHLQELSLINSYAITAQGLQVVVESAKDLRVLVFSGDVSNTIRDEELEKIASFEKLQKLALSIRFDTTDRGIGHLSRCTNLRFLKIDGDSLLTDEALKTIGALPLIEHLELCNMRKVTDVGIAKWINFKSLKTVIFRGYCELNNIPASVIKRHNSTLQVVDFSEIKGMREEAFCALGTCVDLKQLVLSHFRTVSSEWLKHLLPLKKLEHLDLAYTAIGDDALRVIGQFDALHTLILTNCKQLTRKGFAFIQPLKKLQKLDLTDCDGVTDEVVEFCSRLPHLRYLSLYNCNQVTPFAIKDLLRLEKLRYLRISIFPFGKNLKKKLEKAKIKYGYNV